MYEGEKGMDEKKITAEKGCCSDTQYYYYSMIYILQILRLTFSSRRYIAATRRIMGEGEKGGQGEWVCTNQLSQIKFSINDN